MGLYCQGPIHTWITYTDLFTLGLVTQATVTSQSLHKQLKPLSPLAAASAKLT